MMFATVCEDQAGKWLSNLKLTSPWIQQLILLLILMKMKLS